MNKPDYHESVKAASDLLLQMVRHIATNTDWKIQTILPEEESTSDPYNGPFACAFCSQRAQYIMEIEGNRRITCKFHVNETEAELRRVIAEKALGRIYSDTHDLLSNGFTPIYKESPNLPDLAD